MKMAGTRWMNRDTGRMFHTYAPWWTAVERAGQRWKVKMVMFTYFDNNETWVTSMMDFNHHWEQGIYYRV